MFLPFGETFSSKMTTLVIVRIRNCTIKFFFSALAVTTRLTSLLNMLISLGLSPNLFHIKCLTGYLKELFTVTI